MSHSSDNRMSPGGERKSPTIWRGNIPPDLPKLAVWKSLTVANMRCFSWCWSMLPSTQIRERNASSLLLMYVGADPEIWLPKKRLISFPLHSQLALVELLRKKSAPMLPFFLPFSCLHPPRAEMWHSLRPRLLFPLTSLAAIHRRDIPETFVWVLLASVSTLWSLSCAVLWGRLIDGNRQEEEEKVIHHKT